MPTVGEQAHDKDGNKVFDTKVPKVPEDPRDDMSAAGHALWRLMLAKATVGVPENKRWEETRNGDCKGVVWEGRRADLIRELWPTLERGVYKDLGTQFQRYTRGNLINMYNGRGMPSMWWIAYVWVERDVDWSTSHNHRAKQKAAVKQDKPATPEQADNATPTPRDMPAQKPQPALVLKESVSMSTGMETPQPRDLAGFLAGMQEIVQRDQLRGEKRVHLLAEIDEMIALMHKVREFVENF